MAQAQAKGPAKAPAPKRVALNMKASPALRAKVDEAANRSGLSIAQEVERRLLASIEADDDFGGPRTANLLRAAVEAIGFAEQSTGKHWLDDFGTFHVAKRLIDVLMNERTPTPPSNEAIAAAYHRLKAAEEEEANALRDMFDKAPRPGSLVLPNAFLDQARHKKPSEAEKNATAKHMEALSAFFSGEEGRGLADHSAGARRRHQEAAKTFEESWHNADEVKAEALKRASDIIESRKLRQARSAINGA